MLLKSSDSQHGATSKRKPWMCVHLAHAVIHLKKKVREPRACSCAGRPTLTMSTRSRQPIQPHTSHPKKQRAILTARRISELRAVYVPCLYCPRFKYSETLSSALMAVQITPHARCWPPAVTDTTTHSVFTGHRTPQLHRLLYSFPSLLPEQLTITNPCVFEKKKGNAVLQEKIEFILGFLGHWYRVWPPSGHPANLQRCILEMGTTFNFWEITQGLQCGIRPGFMLAAQYQQLTSGPWLSKTVHCKENFEQTNKTPIPSTTAP